MYIPSHSPYSYTIVHCAASPPQSPTISLGNGQVTVEIPAATSTGNVPLLGLHVPPSPPPSFSLFACQLHHAGGDSLVANVQGWLSGMRRTQPSQRAGMPRKRFRKFSQWHQLQRLTMGLKSRRYLETQNPLRMMAQMKFLKMILPSRCVPLCPPLPDRLPPFVCVQHTLAVLVTMIWFSLSE